jgi:hypothetical protein
MAGRALLGAAASSIVAAAALAGGCQSSVSYVEGSQGSGDRYVFITGQGGGGSMNVGPVGVGGSGGLPEVPDPGCADPPPPQEEFTCDAYNQKGCPPGQGCYIFVQYPQETCGQEIYGSICAPGGTGKQGDDCGGAEQCAGGYVCVITGQGTQCVKLCKLTGSSGCPDGLVCETIDVKGFGGCL